MLHNRSFWMGLVVVLVICGIIGNGVYHLLFIELFGFQLIKSQIQTVIVYTDKHAYYVNNPKLVEQIYMDAASLQRSHRIVSENFPEYKIYTPMRKLLIQTKEHSTYGGSIWANGNLMDANGYHWLMTPQLLKLLSRSIQDNQTTKLF